MAVTNISSKLTFSDDV